MKSQKTILKQGILQGSLLSPLLFLFYFDDLHWGSGYQHVSLFAEDVAILVQDSKLHIAEERLQQGLDVVTACSKDWKMLLSAQKSECCFFSTNLHESKWQPALTIDGQSVLYNATPKFIGVTYVHQLTFSHHAALVSYSLKHQRPVKASLCKLGISPSSPTCNLHHNSAFKGGKRRIFMSAVDIDLNAEESREITALRRTSHHWPALCYSCRSHPCRSEPTINKDKGNPAEYDHHGEITEDNTNKFATCNSDLEGMQKHPKA